MLQMKIKSSKISGFQFKKGDARCAICGGEHGITPFKGGFICAGCLQLIKQL